MYHGEKVGDIEADILACILLVPKCLDNLIVSEKHFKRFGHILTFFKEVYREYNDLDVNLIFSIVKKESELQLLETVTYLLDVFVLPSNFMVYQKRLLEMYSQGKKEEWLKKKIYEKATKLYVGTISLKQFNKEVNDLQEQADRLDWR